VRKFFLSILGVALLATACSGPADEEVATYNGMVITVDDVSSLFSTESIPIDNLFRNVAFRIIAIDILEANYDQEFGTELDDAAVETRSQEMIAEIEAQGLTIPEYFGYEAATEALVQSDARASLIQEGVIAALVSDPDLIADMQTAASANPAAFTTVCIRHILTETDVEALAVFVRLEAGEDFGTVADEVSLDASPAGDLGCSAPGRYVEPFAEATMAAEVGVLFGPVATNFGFHVLIVDERITATAEDIASDPDAFLTVEQIDSLWFTWLNEQLVEADIEVNPKFGVWDPETVQIVAPPAE